MRLFRRHEPVNEEPKELAAYSPAEYDHLTERLADRYPWLGLPPFESSLTRKAPRKLFQNPGYLRRVLIAWLIGRPVSDVAKRAGCSPRSVYNVIERTIYYPDPSTSMADWSDLGLVAVMDGPSIEFEAHDPVDRRPLDNQELPVVCLVCHRVAAKTGCWSDIRRYDGSLINPVDDRWDESLEEMSATHGHLICHFNFGLDPINYKPRTGMKYQFLARVFGLEDRIEEYRELDRWDGVPKRTHWTDYVDQDALSVYSDWCQQGEPELTPMLEGREMRTEEAREFWTRVLRGEGPPVEGKWR